MPKEKIDHPDHYGGKDNPYEAIKVIEAWGLGFNLGNTVKYISRAGKKGSRKEDLEKALWYLKREINPNTDRQNEDVLQLLWIAYQSPSIREHMMPDFYTKIRNTLIEAGKIKNDQAS